MSLIDRHDKILYAVVHEHVATGEPIGSQWLATRFDFGCRSATLRNDMSAMAELGYLSQPHTSSGRVPTPRGYRYYVDRLMEPDELSTDPGSLASDDVLNRTEDVNQIVSFSCRLLSDMTDYPSVATRPGVDATTLHRIYLSSATEHHHLLVLLLSTGQVIHRLLVAPQQSSDADLQRCANYLNELIAGTGLSEVASRRIGPLPMEMEPDRRRLDHLLDAIREETLRVSQDQVHLEGANRIMRQREFRDVERLERLLNTLNENSAMFRVFSLAVLSSHGVRVIIGPESGVDGIEDCSLVASPYYIGDRTGGYIGVIGPIRMHYDRTVPVVAFVASQLSNLLTRVQLT